MKTLTVKQPWSYLLCSGLKDIENRTWKTNYRGTILIHSSAKGIDYRNPNSLFTKEQWNAIPKGIQEKMITMEVITDGAIIGSVEIVDCVQNHPSVWAEKGVWNWVVKNQKIFDSQITNVKGKLMLWDYDIEKKLDEEVKRFKELIEKR